jgi:hypothetical protein
MFSMWEYLWPGDEARDRSEHLPDSKADNC